MDALIFLGAAGGLLSLANGSNGSLLTRELRSACLRDVALGTPFAALPSMRNLALTYEEESMSEVDGATLIARSLKQQRIDHLFGVVGFPATPIAAAAQKA